MSDVVNRTPIDILLVEDNPGDVHLLERALRNATMMPNQLYVVRDGSEAMAFLGRQGNHADAPRPDLILLDLNLPKRNGQEVLTYVKQDPDLRRIPVVVISSSSAEQDIFSAYDRHANCYVTKPAELGEYLATAKFIEKFWLSVAELPPK